MNLIKWNRVVTPDYMSGLDLAPDRKYAIHLLNTFDTVIILNIVTVPDIVTEYLVRRFIIHSQLGLTLN